MAKGYARKIDKARDEAPDKVPSCRMPGNWRDKQPRLFIDDADRERFIERLAERVEQFEIRLYRFVCMTNHFHRFGVQVSDLQVRRRNSL